MSRTVVWFSCGAASAVAAKLTLAATPDAEIVYTDTGSEHPDNARFLSDVQAWLGRPVQVLRSEKYASTWQVWEETGYLVGPYGARCTGELKKKIRFAFQELTDIQVFGYTAEETARAQRFREQNPEVELHTPLIDRGITKADCLGLIEMAGIELPAMYRLGYRNNNCVGCVKGGIGYWNKIRRDFPETFNRMAALETTLGHTILRDNGHPLPLAVLDPARGSHQDEPDIECSLLCYAVSASVSAQAEAGSNG